MLAMLHMSANENDFFLTPNANAINNTSGGTGKNEDSANARIKSAIGP